MADQEETPLAPAPDPVVPDTTESQEQQQDDGRGEDPIQEEGQKTEEV